MATAEERASEWQVGDAVSVRGARWRVAGISRFADCVSLRLHPSSGGRRTTTLLLPFDRPVRSVPRAAPLRHVRLRQWLHVVRSALASALPYGSLRTVAASRIRILPHQLEPALAIRRDGETRLLIADEVGLGKTVQAGLVISELAAESDVFRGLVVVPAGLRAQWIDELDRHFGHRAIPCDAAWLRQAARDLPADVNPWALPGTYLVSVDFIKQPEVLRPVQSVTWDLLVVDEAHAATPGTSRGAALEALGATARHVVLLTATPHRGDAAAFESLCRIGQIDERRPILCFRRGRTALGECLRRRTSLLVVRPTAEEERMHRMLERYTACLWREAATRGDLRGRLVSTVLRKRALSSAASVRDSLDRRVALLSVPAAAAERQLLLPLGDEDPLEDAVPEDVLGAPGLNDGDRERRWLRRLARQASAAAGAESKMACLARFLRRVREPLLVFTEYRDTLERLAPLVAAAGRAPIALHGGMSLAERRAAQQAFNGSGGCLLATDAASEGLNLHERCRIVVHYELPWSPARLEQRTGRVDRIGQQRRVHEILLVAGDTAERLVLAPLARKAIRARADGSPVAEALTRLGDATVAELVMAGASLPSRPEAFQGPDRVRQPDERLHAAAEDEAGRLGRVRERPVPNGNRSKATAVCADRRSRTPSTQAVVVFQGLVRSSSGELLHREPIGVVARTPRPGRDTDPLMAGETLLVRTRSTAAERLAGIARRVGAIHREKCERLMHRETGIASSKAAGEPVLVQAGLFERHALRERERAEETARVAAEEMEHRRSAPAERLETCLQPVAVLLSLIDR